MVEKCFHYKQSSCVCTVLPINKKISNVLEEQTLTFYIAGLVI